MRRVAVVATVALLAMVWVPPAGAQDPSSELEQVEEEIASLTSRIEEAQAQRSNVAVELDSARARVEEVFGQLRDAQAAVEEVEAKIAAEEAELAELQRQLELLLADLAETRLAIRNTRNDLEVQVVEMYMDASTSSGASMLTFDTAADVAVGLSYTDNVAGASEQLIDGFVALQAEEERQQAAIEEREAGVEAALASLAADKEVLEAELAKVAELQAQAEQDLTDVQNLLNRINSDIAAAEQHLDGLEAESARLEDEIRAQQDTGGESPGVIGWPVSGPVTSAFGYRVHPIFGTRRLHTGVDIGVGSGVAIVAAESGTVILASPYGGYGNAVVVDHGGGLTTLYAHQSSIAVSSGQSVSRGDVVGYVGCTGYCTGPHLHFETRENGAPVDPMRYLG